MAYIILFIFPVTALLRRRGTFFRFVGSFENGKDNALSGKKCNAVFRQFSFRSSTISLPLRRGGTFFRFVGVGTSFADGEGNALSGENCHVVF